MRFLFSMTAPFGALLLLLFAGCAATSAPKDPGPGGWWTFNPSSGVCLRANVSPDLAGREALARGGACRRLRSFDPDAVILMCTQAQGDKLRVRIAGFGRDETACRAAGRDVIRHLNELRRKK